MKHFTLGPVEMYPYTLELGRRQVPYFRTDEFSDVVLETERMLKKAADCAENDRVLLLTTSGTGAMEAAVMNCLDKDDRVLVIDGGSFGHRFVELCRLHQIPCEVLELKFGDALTAERLQAYDGKGFTALLVNIHETSTGQLYDGKMLSEFCRKNNMYFIVDAISSFLADPISVREWGIDVLILSSQKGLALPPGLSAIVLSGRMMKRTETAETKCMYFDFKRALADARRGQTPFTPAVGIVYQLHDRLQHIENEGVDAVIEATANVARDFRKRLSELPVSLPAYPMSNAATPLILEHAKDVYTRLRYEFSMTLTPNGGALADTVLRVGHLGNHTVEDNVFLIQALKQVLCPEK